MLKFGVVGTSWITDEYVTGALETGLWSLSAVYSRKSDTAQAFAQKYGGAECFTDMEEMAESKLIDAVYIASPNMLHYKHCKCFLERGKHVICEKPVYSQAEKVRELQRIAEERGAVFLEAIMYMHLPQRKKLQQAIGSIGDISLVKLDFCQRSSKYDSYLAGNLPNIFNPAMETGAFMDLGVYCVYPALHLFGEPDSVSAQGIMMDSGADATGVITMKYPDKLIILTYSKIGQAAAGSEFQGQRGTVYVDSISRLAGMEVLSSDGSKKRLHEQDSKSRLMGYEALDFCNFIMNPEKNRDDYAECKKLCLNVSEFMEKLRKEIGIAFPDTNP